jgi:1-deoxyxylulose-5-phosphate synthase
MEYRKLGRSGLNVSALCLGAMNFGSRTEPDESVRIIHEATDTYGYNFIDTANSYGIGVSETIVGRALGEGGRRDRVVLATKVTSAMSDDPNDAGYSRYSVMKHCEQSLRRLNTDRIDLYQLHLMDLTTPLDEVLRALDDLVRQGKVRYIGCSKFAPALTAEAVMLSERFGWSRLVCEQPPYNLLDRRIENEMIWNCQRHGLGIIPWAPMAAGILSAKYARDAFPAGSRFDSLNNRLNERAIEIAQQVAAMAAEKAVTAAEFALAWVLRQPGITAPIVGVRTMEQLASSVNALNVSFTADDHARINELVPPGTAVSNYYEANIDARLRVAAGIPGAERGVRRRPQLESQRAPAVAR